MGGGGGCTPIPFTIVNITYNVAVYVAAEKAGALPHFCLYCYMYSVDI